MLILNPKELEIKYNSPQCQVVWGLSRDSGWKALFDLSPLAQSPCHYLVPWGEAFEPTIENENRLVSWLKIRIAERFGASGEWPSADWSCGALIRRLPPARFASLFEVVNIKTKAGQGTQAFEAKYGAVDDFEPQVMPSPTKTTIGSRGRIQVYRRRLERGEHLYHPDDCCDFAENRNGG